MHIQNTVMHNTFYRSFGFSVKQSSFVYGYKFLVWPLLMNRSDDGLIEKPKLVP